MKFPFAVEKSLLRHWATAGLLSAVLALTVGCSGGQPMGTVKGTVTANGKPYSNAGIMFISLETGNGSGGDINPDGTFSLPDAIPVGTYSVYLAPLAVEGDVDAPPVPVHVDKSIPSKYWSESTTDIKIDVKEGANDVPVELSGR